MQIPVWALPLTSLPVIAPPPILCNPLQNSEQRGENGCISCTLINQKQLLTRCVQWWLLINTQRRRRKFHDRSNNNLVDYRFHIEIWSHILNHCPGAPFQIQAGFKWLLGAMIQFVPLYSTASVQKLPVPTLHLRLVSLLLFYIVRHYTYSALLLLVKTHKYGEKKHLSGVPIIVHMQVNHS